MEGKDERFDLIQTFTVNSFRLDPESWREFVSEEDNQVVFISFFDSRDFKILFISRDSEDGLNVSFQFPQNVKTKVICVSKTARDAVTEDNVRSRLSVQEIHGEDAMTFTVSVCEQVACMLLGSPAKQQPISWAAGEDNEPQTIMERQKTATLVMRAQIEGQIFLPHPEVLQDVGPYDDCEGGELPPTCDTTITEWVELVSELLKEDSSETVLKGLKPFPSEEFNFWLKRLNNLLFLQKQLQSSRAQQVAVIVQQVDSVLWSSLQDIYRDVEKSLREAEEVSQALRPLQETLGQVEQVEYQQLALTVEAVIEQVHQAQIQSQFYRNPHRVLVLLIEICNLFIQKSREFLRREEVMRGLVSNPGRVLDDVRLVIKTLQMLRKAFIEIQNQDQGGVTHSSDSQSHQADFLDLENLLNHLYSMQEVLCVTLQLSSLDQVVLAGVNGSMWTAQVQDVYQEFLQHLKVLSKSNCDPTDPEDQSLQLYIDQFMLQVSDQETRLVSLLNRALEDCCKSSSAAQLVQMFWFLLDHPLIRDLLPPLLVGVVGLVLEELDQTEQLFHSQREDSGTFSRSMSSAAARLCWTRQLKLRAEDALKSYRTIQHLLSSSGESQVVLLRFSEVLGLLQVLRKQVCSDWISQLDLDCRFILDQPLTQWDVQGMLVVGCSQKLLVALRDLRYVSSLESDMELRPQAALLLTCRDDITQSYLVLSQLVSCYNQVLNDALQMELPLIQDQLQDLNQHLSELQRNTWSCKGLQHLVEQQKDRVMVVHSTVSEARANMKAMTYLIQGWAGLHLLQSSGDSLLKGGANEQSHRQLREGGQQLLRMIQVNRSLYGAEETSESWSRYLDHIDDQVQEGLLQMLLRTLQHLSDCMSPQSSGGVLLAVSLTLQETDSAFEPALGGDLSGHLKSIITDVYAAAGELPRISVSHLSNYQVSLQQHPALCQLEQEVMHHLVQVKKEVKHLRAGLDRYSHLWESDRMAAMEEFLTYGRQLGPEELEAKVTPPTLKDYRRQIEMLHTLSTEVIHLDDVITLNGWLQVDLRPFRESLLSIIYNWKHLYTEQLLTSLTDSLQQVCHLRGNDDEEVSSPLRFPLTETVVLLEAAGVQLPEHLAAQLQCC